MSMNAHPASSRAAKATRHDPRIADSVAARETRARAPIEAKRSANASREVLRGGAASSDVAASSSSGAGEGSASSGADVEATRSAESFFSLPRVCFPPSPAPTRISAVVSATSACTTASSALCASRAAEASHLVLFPPSTVVSLTPPEPPPPAPPPEPPASYPYPVPLAHARARPTSAVSARFSLFRAAAARAPSASAPESPSFSLSRSANDDASFAAASVREPGGPASGSESSESRAARPGSSVSPEDKTAPFAAAYAAAYAAGVMGDPRLVPHAASRASALSSREGWSAYAPCEGSGKHERSFPSHSKSTRASQRAKKSRANFATAAAGVNGRHRRKWNAGCAASALATIPFSRGRTTRTRGG